jgi:hypothetical protein
MAFNATGASLHDDLYAGTDFSSLSWFEHQWAWWYVTIGNPVIATGLMSFLLHEVSIIILLFVLASSKHGLPTHRLSILDEAYLGSSSMPSPTSASISYSPIKSLRLLNNGSARRVSYSRTLQLSFPRLVWYPIFPNVYLTSLLDLAISPHGRIPWHVHLPGTLPILEDHCASSSVILRLRGLLPLPWYVKILHRSIMQF